MTRLRDDHHARAAERTAEQQRSIQSGIDHRDAENARKKEAEPKPSQLGPREYPVPPLGEQKQPKPGHEAELDPRPMYEAPGYKGSEKLEGMVALITGGDSGIGRGVAVLFAREGADVAVVYLIEHENAEETKRAVEAEGRRCILIPGDVVDPEFCRSAVERTFSQLGKLDILVNNAVFQEHAVSLEAITEEHFDKTVKTDLYGYFHMAKAALPHLRKGSSIINTGSVTGIRCSKELLDYSMTKGGIHAFTKALSANVLPRGIRVNAVAPGPVWTPLNPADRSAKSVSEFGSGSPMRRPAQPEEIAPAYVFLAAPSCASYITGEVIPIIGGYSS